DSHVHADPNTGGEPNAYSYRHRDRHSDCNSYLYTDSYRDSHVHTDANAGAESNPYSDRHGHGNSYIYSNSYSDSHLYSDANAYGDSYSYGYGHPNADPNHLADNPDGDSSLRHLWRNG